MKSCFNALVQSQFSGRRACHFSINQRASVIVLFVEKGKYLKEEEATELIVLQKNAGTILITAIHYFNRGISNRKAANIVHVSINRTLILQSFYNNYVVNIYLNGIASKQLITLQLLDTLILLLFSISRGQIRHQKSFKQSFTWNQPFSTVVISTIHSIIILINRNKPTKTPQSLFGKDGKTFAEF